MIDSGLKPKQFGSKVLVLHPLAIKYFLKIDCFFCFMHVGFVQSNDICEILGSEVLDITYLDGCV